MNYHRNCSASGMFVFIVYLVLWNCGATIFMVLCSDSTTATIQSPLPLFRPSAVIRYVEALGAYSIYTKTSCLY